MLRMLLIEELGGLSAVAETLGVSRQLIDYWRTWGVPLERTSEAAHKLFGNYKLRWALNFIDVYKYERWSTPGVMINDFWSDTVIACKLLSNIQKRKLIEDFYNKVTAVRKAKLKKKANA